MSRRLGRSLLVSAVVFSLATAMFYTLGPSASANDPLEEGPASLQDFARRSVPEWNFAFANRNAPCWPEDAFKPDVT